MTNTRADFDPTSTYVELRDGGAAREIEVTASFWPDLTSGRLLIDGRLVADTESGGS